jgi:hypothetical protein
MAIARRKAKKKAAKKRVVRKATKKRASVDSPKAKSARAKAIEALIGSDYFMKVWVPRFVKKYGRRYSDDFEYLADAVIDNAYNLGFSAAWVAKHPAEAAMEYDFWNEPEPTDDGYGGYSGY